MERNPLGRFTKQESKSTRTQIERKSKHKAHITPIGRSRRLLWRAHRVSKENGWHCDLDLAWILERMENGFCEITGVKFVLDGGPKHPNAPSLDRTDSTKPYIKENVKLTTWIYNQAKNEYSHLELVGLARVMMQLENDCTKLGKVLKACSTVTLCTQ
jgi:hypothetical protein